MSRWGPASTAASDPCLSCPPDSAPLALPAATPEPQTHHVQPTKSRLPAAHLVTNCPSAPKLPTCSSGSRSSNIEASHVLQNPTKLSTLSPTFPPAPQAPDRQSQPCSPALRCWLPHAPSHTSCTDGWQTVRGPRGREERSASVCCLLWCATLSAQARHNKTYLQVPPFHARVVADGHLHALAQLVL